jgi:peptide/nickel transport system ATP-binding protein
MFITHDFGVVAEIADRVAVMQFGRIVETGTAGAVLDDPQHPYTRKLIAAIPRLGAGRARLLNEKRPVLEVEGLSKTYRAGGGIFSKPRIVEAVRNVSLRLVEGETLGIVGESGSGKSSVGRCLVRLMEPDRGTVLLAGRDMAHLKGEHLRAARASIQMIFQDPYASLNPRARIGRIIAEGPMAHGVPRREAYDRAARLLELVGLDASAIGRYPHEFSGGQRQRIGIARALMFKPKLLIADEAVSALDVSIQAQILKLLDQIQRETGVSMIFITHDLRVASQICDEIAVMQKGRIVEHGPPSQIFLNPQSAYTRELVAAIPGEQPQTTSPIAANG